jgi:hypothetical protein
MQIRMQTQSGSCLHARVPVQLVQQLAMAKKKNDILYSLFALQTLFFVEAQAYHRKIQ